MSFKKNWFGYIVWTVYSIVLCVILATYLNVQCTLHKLGKQETVFVVCAVFGGIFIIYWILCLGFQKWGYKLFYISGHSKTLWEIFFVLSLFFGAVLARFDWYLHHFVKFGDTESLAGSLFQAVFQLAGILLLYFGIKNLSGRTAAICAMAFMAFLPAVLQQNISLIPENLYFFLFIIMLFLISCYYKHGKTTKKSKVIEVFLLAALGIGTGYMIYLDIIGSLLVVLTWFVLADRRGRGIKAAAAVVFTAACIIGLFFFLCLQSFLNGNVFLKTLVLWRDLFFPFQACGKIGASDIMTGGTLLLCAGAVWCMLDFWTGKRDRGGLYVSSILVLLVFVFFGKSNMNYRLLTTFYWSVLASVGVASVVEAKEKQTEKGQGGDFQYEELQPEKIEQEKSKREECMNKENTAIPETEGKNSENKKEIKFIENPLPLPKKHVKKTMDYRFIPDKEQMDYDIEVDKNDDFDLK